MAELVDALDLGSSGATRRGSTPLSRNSRRSMKQRERKTDEMDEESYVLLLYPEPENAMRLCSSGRNTAFSAGDKKGAV